MSACSLRSRSAIPKWERSPDGWTADVRFLRGDFAEQACFSVAVRAGECDAFCAELADFLNGRVKICEQKREFFAVSARQSGRTDTEIPNKKRGQSVWRSSEDSSSRKNRQRERNFGFGRYFTDYMFTMKYTKEAGWHDAKIEPNEPKAFDLAHEHLSLCAGDIRGHEGVLAAGRLDRRVSVPKRTGRA